MKTLLEQQSVAWVNAPKEANFIAQDGDTGWWCAYVKKPRQKPTYEYWIINNDPNHFHYITQGTINGWDWKDTLQSREEWSALMRSQVRMTMKTFPH